MSNYTIRRPTDTRCISCGELLVEIVEISQVVGTFRKKEKHIGLECPVCVPPRNLGEGKRKIPRDQYDAGKLE